MTKMTPYIEGKTFVCDKMKIDGESWFRLTFKGFRFDVYLTPQEKDEMFELIRNKEVQ